MGTGTASPHKKRTRRFDPNQGDSRSMKQTTLDSYVLGEPNVSDAGSQHWEKRTPQREPASFSSVDQGHIPSESQLTQHSLSSVAEATVAGVLRRLGLQRSGLGQGSESFSREIDSSRNKKDEVADRLSMLAKECGVSLEALESFQEFQRNPHSSREGLSGLSREAVLRIAEGFKREADTIGDMCMKSRVNGRSFLLREFCKACEESKQVYKERRKQNSSLQDITSTLTRYQQAVSSLSQFTINNMMEAQIEFSDSGKIEQFIKAIDNNVTNSLDKQGIIKNYSDMYQNCDKKCKDFMNMINNNSYKSAFDLERSINYVKRDIIALGNIIKEDYFQSHTNLPLLETIHSHVETYGRAMASCDEAREKGDEAGVQKQLCNTVKAVEELSKAYSQLAELALKGKGVAIESPAVDHVYHSLEEDSDVEMRQNQEKADLKYAQWLAGQENEQLARDHVELSKDSGSVLKRGSTSSEMAMEEGSQQDRSLESRQGERSTDSVFLRESDGENHISDGEAVTGMDWRESTDVRRRRDKKLCKSERLKVAQGKLEIYLRDPTYLSAEEIRDVSLELSKQLDDIRKRCYALTGQGKQQKGMRSLLLKRLFDGQRKITEQDAKKLFHTIKIYQEITYKQFKTIFGGLKYNRKFKRFMDQIEQSLERRQTEKNIEAYKAEIGARELGYLFLNERGGVAWGHTTFAVAYMPDRMTGKLHGFISVNEPVSDNAIGKVVGEFRAKYPNERFTLIKRGVREQRHAEEVLLGYAKNYQLEIFGIGASRPFCSSCCELLEMRVDQQALGQSLRGGDGREKSSKYWGEPRGGGKRRRVNWEIDDKDTYLSDIGEERVSAMGNVDSAERDKQRREQIYEIQPKVKFLNKNDEEANLNEETEEEHYDQKLKVDKVDAEAIKILERKKEQSRKSTQKWQKNLREKAAKGDHEAKGTLMRREKQKKESTQKWQKNLREKAAKGDHEAKEMLESQKERSRINLQKWEKNLEEKAIKGDIKAIKTLERRKEQRKKSSQKSKDKKKKTKMAREAK